MSSIRKLEKKDLRQFVRACGSGDLSSVGRLLRKGADPDVLIENYGLQPLTAACESGHIEIVQLLLDHGADPNIRAPGLHMRTALEIACQKGRVKIAEELIKGGADIDKEGYWPPLKTALSYDQTEIVRLLISLGAKWEPSWIFQAAGGAGAATVRLLVEAGWNVNFETGTGETPLHLVARRRDPALTRLLLQAGARATVNLQTAGLRQTPLMVAAETGHIEVIRLLLEAGADPRLTDRSHKTAEQIARSRRYNHPEAARFLRDYARQHPQKPAARLRKHAEATAQKRPAAKHIHIALSRYAKGPGPYGAADFVSMVHDYGHPEWAILAVEAPLEKVTRCYCNLFEVAGQRQDVPIKPSRATDKSMAEWIPFVQAAGCEWTVILRVVCYPIGSMDIEGSNTDAKRLSGALRTRALAFFGEDTAFDMTCYLFEKGHRAGSESWRIKGSTPMQFSRSLDCTFQPATRRSGESQLGLLSGPPLRGRLGAPVWYCRPTERLRITRCPSGTKGDDRG